MGTDATEFALPYRLANALESTAGDMDLPGFDFDPGYGFCLADQALASLSMTEACVADPANGVAVMEVPDCAWHVCPAAESLPDPNALPEEGCLLICKGAFEALFDGRDGGLRMEFDPHLPETSCTVRMTWQPRN